MYTAHTVIDSPLGPLTLVADDGVLAGVYFDQHHRRPEQARFGEREDAAFGVVRQQLDEYFGRSRTSFDLALAPRGTDFQRRVWDQLRQIPYGETRSYGHLARLLGNPGLAREVGAANGRNPISVIVPCHRVVGADGKLVGYAGGLDRKRFLLDLEAQTAPQMR